MQETMDILYEKSKNGEIFTDLIPIIISDENIRLAYRNIKANDGSETPGTDGKRMTDIGKLNVDEVKHIIMDKLLGPQGYSPQPVRRVEIPKTSDPTKTRPLGIPCIWDRLIQQCIKQVMEPICEAKFYQHSYGFRPNRSAEHAMARVYQLMQINNLHYVVEFDIKGFFDNVNHSKLIKQIWAMGIRDKTLIYIIKKILKAPIRLPNGDTILPNKGTPQGGIISPLLANIVLNELDHWIEGQWEENPVVYKYAMGTNKNGSKVKSAGYRGMRNTNLKEMYIVRYADDFRILCRTKTDAKNIMIAVTQWLGQRLKLEVSPEKTRIVNIKKKYAEFLGFKLKVRKKGYKEKRKTWDYNEGNRSSFGADILKWKQEHPEKTQKECAEALKIDISTVYRWWKPTSKNRSFTSKPKYVVESHISDKKAKAIETKLKRQIHQIGRGRDNTQEAFEVRKYNAIVMGVHNYCKIATHVNIDLNPLGRVMLSKLKSELNSNDNNRVVRNGRELTPYEKGTYGKSQQIRFIKGSNEPIYPIAYVQTVHPMLHRPQTCCYTESGRKLIHTELGINKRIMRDLMKSGRGFSIEYADNRISLYTAQQGRCSITGRVFMNANEIHCHHKVPREQGGTDRYQNLTLIYTPVHLLIHATNTESINNYLKEFNLDESQISKVNKLRIMAQLNVIQNYKQ